MRKERLQEVLLNLVGWALDHNDEFYEAFIHASGLTQEELREVHQDFLEAAEEDLLEQFFQSILELDNAEEDYEDDFNTEEVNDKDFKY